MTLIQQQRQNYSADRLRMVRDLQYVEQKMAPISHQEENVVKRVVRLESEKDMAQTQLQEMQAHDRVSWHKNMPLLLSMQQVFLATCRGSGVVKTDSR